MKAHFPEFYRPSEDEFASLWASATVVLDASVLLDLYEYSRSTVDETFAVLQTLANLDRLWLPHQSALEYQRGRPGVIFAQETEQYDVAYNELATLRKIAKNLDDKLRQHAYLDASETAALISKAADEFEDHLKAAKAAHPNLRVDDPIRARLDDLYEGRIGEPWTVAKLDEASKAGKDRYDHEIPPGYSDKGKPARLRYGDLIFWLQTIKHAETNGLDVIVVTNDSKEDWWTKPGGLVFGPHPELRAEFLKETGHRFYMYSHDRFMTWAADYLQVGVDQQAIDEIRDVRETKETDEFLVNIGEKLRESLNFNPDLGASSAALARLADSIKFANPNLGVSNAAIAAMLQSQKFTNPNLDGAAAAMARLADSIKFANPNLSASNAAIAAMLQSRTLDTSPGEPDEPAGPEPTEEDGTGTTTRDQPIQPR